MKGNRFLSLVLCAALVFALLPVSALAASVPGSFVFDVGEGNIVIAAGTAAGTLKVTYGTLPTTTDDFPNTQNITIIGTTTGNTVKVGNGVTANITLDGASILLTREIPNGDCAFDMAGATVNLHLEGANTLQSGGWNAGLQCPEGATLVISDGPGDGIGSLSAAGGNFEVNYSGAGIGGGGDWGKSGGIITIDGGMITAMGGFLGAGIGGGSNGAGGTITINGGTIMARGGDSDGSGNGEGAGIGGGRDGGGGTVNINGGMVTALGGAGGGAGIGGGLSFSNGAGGTVTITGGTVTAVGGSSMGLGAGIGGGGCASMTGGDGGTVYISGGSVKAVSGGYGAEAIGHGDRNGGSGTLKNKPGDGGVDVFLTTVTLSDVSEATAVKSLVAALGDAPYVYGTNDMFTDAEGKLYPYLPKNTSTTAAQTNSGKYVGTAIETNNSGTAAGIFYLRGLTVTGGELGTDYTYGTDGVLRFKIPGSYTVSMAPSVTATTDRIIVTGGTAADPYNVTLDGVRIELDRENGGCAFDMAGATVNLYLEGESILQSGGPAAGLHCPSGATLVIWDGQGDGTGSLSATGGSNNDNLSGAGIGGNNAERCGTVTVQSGEVTAKGGYFSAGIGGAYAAGGNVTINGGKVTAVGGWHDGEAKGHGAGIGGGIEAEGGTVDISGGTVNATGGGIGGAGIGGGGNITGDGGGGGSVTISGGTVTAVGGNMFSFGGAGIGGGGSGIIPTSRGGAGGQVTISGGTVKAIGGYRAASIGGGGGISTGGNGTLMNKPVEEGGVNVFLTTVTLDGVNAGTAVTSLTTNLSYTYGTNDMFTDADGKLYLYLPVNASTTAAKTNSGNYVGEAIITDNTGTAEGTFTLELRDLTVTGGAPGTDYTYGDDGVLKFLKNGSYTVSMTTPGTSTTDKIVVQSGVTANITLNGVRILLPRQVQAGSCAFNMAGATVNLTLLGGNTLQSGGGKAGLCCPQGATLTITQGSTGTLTAIAGDWQNLGGAGIGGSYGQAGGDVTIAGGVVYAQGSPEINQDIGYGKSGGPDGGTLTISGTAAVFLWRSREIMEHASPVPQTTTHRLYEFTTHTAGDPIYGIPVPWSGDFRAYLSDALTQKPAPTPYSEPDYIFRTLTDAATGITISGTIHKDAALTVKELTFGADAACEAIKAKQNNPAFAFVLGKDISLSRDFVGTLTVTIPVGMTYNGQTVTVLHCANGTLRTYTAVVADGKAVFTVTSLSPFAVLAAKAAGVPNTGGDGLPPWLALLFLGALCGYAPLRRRGKRM